MTVAALFPSPAEVEATRPQRGTAPSTSSGSCRWSASSSATRHGDEHHPRRRLHLEQPAHRLRGLPGADLGVPDHAAVLLRRRRRMRRHLATRSELGQLADAPLHPALPAGVLLPGVLGVGAGDPAVLPAGARLRTGRRDHIQLLWFLGAYVLVLAAVPLLARITTTGRLLGAVAGTYAFIAVDRRHPDQRRRADRHWAI